MAFIPTRSGQHRRIKKPERRIKRVPFSTPTEADENPLKRIVSPVDEKQLEDNASVHGLKLEDLERLMNELNRSGKTGYSVDAGSELIRRIVRAVSSEVSSGRGAATPILEMPLREKTMPGVSRIMVRANAVHLKDVVHFVIAARKNPRVLEKEIGFLLSSARTPIRMHYWSVVGTLYELVNQSFQTKLKAEFGSPALGDGVRNPIFRGLELE